MTSALNELTMDEPSQQRPTRPNLQFAFFFKGIAVICQTLQHNIQAAHCLCIFILTFTPTLSLECLCHNWAITVQLTTIHFLSLAGWLGSVALWCNGFVCNQLSGWSLRCHQSLKLIKLSLCQHVASGSPPSSHCLIWDDKWTRVKRAK